jgi:hypothetical protein
MKILGMGLNESGELLFPPLDEASFAQRLQQSLEGNVAELRASASATATRSAYQLEIELAPVVDLRDPRAAGWTFLVNEADPDRAAIAEALRPLAEHRGMADPAKPMLFQSDIDWQEWMIDNYSSLGIEQVPHYVLIAGSPQQVPFHFQALLDVAASVGRVDLPPAELRSYADKVIRLEQADGPATTKTAIIFAPDAGRGPDGSYDPTFFSRRYMAEPLAAYARDQLGFQASAIVGDEATKDHLGQALSGARPSLVYTASHGLWAASSRPDLQRQVNGAICCQRPAAAGTPQEWLFTADDVPADQPFLEGAVFFQFACFGYGTPAESDFAHWLGGEPRSVTASEDFVAALPKRLLAHPRGPVAFIGHVDTAWLHGFDDPELPFPVDVWDRRIAPFVQALNGLLTTEPVGRAMTALNERYSTTNAMLTGAYDRLMRGKAKPTAQFWTRLTDTFILRSDAQNYMVFGDPSARLRIAAGLCSLESGGREIGHARVLRSSCRPDRRLIVHRFQGDRVSASPRAGATIGACWSDLRWSGRWPHPRARSSRCSPIPGDMLP